MTAKSTKSKTNRKKTGTTSKKSTSNKKTTKKNTKKTTRSTRTAKSGNSFLMDEILIWITLAVSIILLISNFGVAGFLGDAVSGVLWEIFGAVAYIIPFVLFGLVSFLVSNKGNRYAYMKTVIAVLKHMQCFCCSLLKFCCSSWMNLAERSERDWHLY